MKLKPYVIIMNRLEFLDDMEKVQMFNNVLQLCKNILIQ